MGSSNIPEVGEGVEQQVVRHHDVGVVINRMEGVVWVQWVEPELVERLDPLQMQFVGIGQGGREHGRPHYRQRHQNVSEHESHRRNEPFGSRHPEHRQDHYHHRAQADERTQQLAHRHPDRSEVPGSGNHLHDR
jgi:hypothetical protein